MVEEIEGLASPHFKDMDVVDAGHEERQGLWKIEDEDEDDEDL